MNFNTDVRSPKWEYAYWGATINNWYKEGLPEKNYPQIPCKISTISSSLYTAAWTHKWKYKRNSDPDTGKESPKKEIPDGMAVWGEATYWPTQGFPQDKDVHDYFHHNKFVRLVDVEQIFYPRYDIRILEEDKDSLIYIDLDGITRRHLRKESVIPAALYWPISDRNTWEKVKENRLSLKNISNRFPVDWDEQLKLYKNRDYPLALGGYPLGLFGLPAHLLGYEKLFLMYYDDPDLIRDILETFTTLWISIWEEVLSQIEIDLVHIFEDMSMGTGSLISPKIIREFLIPNYKRITDFLKGKGVEIILLDTDGDCTELIPLLLKGGITGLYPMEAVGGMDLLSVRKKYPELQILGGIPKLEIAKGEKRIDEVLETMDLLLKVGGYIPFCDHSVPPNVSWDNFKYYRKSLNCIIDSRGNR